MWRKTALLFSHTFRDFQHKTYIAGIMIYTLISIVFGPLKSMKPSILPYNNFLIPYSHPKGQLLVKMVIFGHFFGSGHFLPY